jgi:hypothetical protein
MFYCSSNIDRIAYYRQETDVVLLKSGLGVLPGIFLKLYSDGFLSETI